MFNPQTKVRFLKLNIHIAGIDTIRGMPALNQEQVTVIRNICITVTGNTSHKNVRYTNREHKIVLNTTTS